MTELGELTQARNRSISLALNRPGSASFSLPMDDALAPLVQPITTALHVYRISPNFANTAAQFIWNGYVQTIDEDISQNRMTVNCIGFLERLAKRYTRERMTFSAVDDSFIIQTLLAHANLTSNNGYTVPIVSGSFPPTPTWIGGQVLADNDARYPDPLSGSIPYATFANRDKVIEPNTYIGPEITALTELENGCDIWVSPNNKQIWIFRKRMADLPNVIFGYNWGPNNVAQLGRQLDSSTVVNYMLVTSNPTVTPRFQDHAGSQAAYGLIEEVENLAGDFEPTGSLLQYRAAAEVAIRNQPRQVFSMTPFAWSPDSSVPEPFVEYNVGDKVYLSARHGQRINIDMLGMRIFGMSFNIDEFGNEIPQGLQLSPQG